MTVWVIKGHVETCFIYSLYVFAFRPTRRDPHTKTYWNVFFGNVKVNGSNVHSIVSAMRVVKWMRFWKRKKQIKERKVHLAGCGTGVGVGIGKLTGLSKLPIVVAKLGKAVWAVVPIGVGTKPGIIFARFGIARPGTRPWIATGTCAFFFLNNKYEIWNIIIIKGWCKCKSSDSLRELFV